MRVADRVGTKAMLVFLALIAGCSSGGEPDGSGDGEGGEDTAAMVYSTDSPASLWTAEEFGEELSTFFEIGTPNPLDISEAYRTAMARGDALCPGEGEELETDPEGCTTEEGWHFAGIGWYYPADYMELEDGSLMALSFSHGGDFEILSPTLQRIAGGGGIAYQSTREDNVVESIFDVHGSWVDQTRDDWLLVGFSGVFEATVRSYGGDRYGFTVTGGMGLGGRDIFLDTATWDTEDACAGRMSGVVKVRDDRGFWTTWDLGDDCDDCGTVTFHEDDELGELCLETAEWGRRFYSLSTPR